MLIFLFISFVPFNVRSQDIKTERPYIYYPAALQEYELQSSIGVTIARLPRPIVEEELDQSPMLDYNIRFGLPNNFSLLCRISTIGLTNHISAGGKWSFSMNRFSFSIGNQTAYWFGWANFSDFDVRANGINDYPEISMGYDFDRFLLTMKAEAEFLITLNKYSGNIQTSASQSKPVGINFGIFTEQHFLRNNWVTIGLKLHYSKYFYQSWIAFSTLEQWFWIPEINLAYNL